MNRVLHGISGLLCATALILSGCSLLESPWRDEFDRDASQVYNTAALAIEYPNVATAPPELPGPPITINDQPPGEYLDISVHEAVRMGLQNSEVLGGSVNVTLRSPASVTTQFDPAIQATDPAGGVEAALSAFDASFAANTFAQNNDRRINNRFAGGGTRLFLQDYLASNAEISKRAATGTEFTLGANLYYDSNNAPGNLYNSVWENNVEAGFRHPLLRGSGVDVNRITGTSNTPGVYNGVLIARTNEDVSLAEFELNVRNYVSDVENAYWDLYYAYRELDARTETWEAAVDMWRQIHALYVNGRRGGEAVKEAQAREQLFRLQADVQRALVGRLNDGTQTNNGSTGGTFRGTGGVHVAERRLRLLLGLPINDGRLLRPVDEPPMAELHVDWHVSLTEALAHRVELRRQKWLVKRREMELEASHTFLQPQLDILGQYRFRGLGDRLTRDEKGLAKVTGSLNDMGTGDFQEWQVGVELSFPFGYRQAHSAMRNAELKLLRERAVLARQEQEIVHNLANAFADVRRAYAEVKTSFNGYVAAQEQLSAARSALEFESVTLHLLLESQRRVAETESQYYRSLAEYAVAIKNLRLERGTMLEDNQIWLREGGWPAEAYREAEARAELYESPVLIDDLFEQTGVISRGEIPRARTPVPLQPVPGLPAPMLQNPDGGPGDAVPFDPTLPPLPRPLEQDTAPLRSPESSAQTSTLSVGMDGNTDRFPAPGYDIETGPLPPSGLTHAASPPPLPPMSVHAQPTSSPVAMKPAAQRARTNADNEALAPARIGKRHATALTPDFSAPVALPGKATAGHPLFAPPAELPVRSDRAPHRLPGPSAGSLPLPFGGTPAPSLKLILGEPAHSATP